MDVELEHGLHDPLTNVTEDAPILAGNLYHGVLTSCNGFVYSIGAAILDLDEPWRVVARGSRYLLAPEIPHERVGEVPNVIFPSAALVDADRLTIYYGGADTVVCLAHGHLSDVLEHVQLGGSSIV